MVDAVVGVDVCDIFEYGGGAVLDFERATILSLLILTESAGRQVDVDAQVSSLWEMLSRPWWCLEVDEVV